MKVNILLVGMLAASHLSSGVSLFAQEKSDYRGLVPERGTRITGAIDTIIDGKPQLKDGPAILAIAKKTKFNESGSYERKYEGGSIQYVPPELSRDGIGTALTEGVLLYRFTIKGVAPSNVNLKEGTYYFFMQFVNGTWVGVAIDQAGMARCATFGLIVREIFTIHPAGDHPTGSRVVPHKIASDDELARLGRTQARPFDWIGTDVSWEPIGVACKTVHICAPGGT
jgi:hypothetical protein